MMETPISHEYVTEFNPQSYLRSYYTGPDSEDRFVTRCMVDALRTMPSDLLTLELGGGPTLFAVATLAPYSREIHFCDLLPANLNEVRRWLENEPDAFDWGPYIEMTLEEEGLSATPANVAHRAEEMRRKVTRLLSCNALDPAPLGSTTQTYDLVVAQTSLDAMSATIEEWKQVMRNVSDTLVAPQGRLLVSLVSGTEGYSVGDKTFPVLPLTVDDVRQGYIEAGFKANTLQIETMPAPDARDYVGLIAAVAQK
ncbi:MAG: hypothetical protein KDJ65_22785 [Anaerolineae bacterium]|nr:hypothetical protein [Anaerolineae bacterium]